MSIESWQVLSGILTGTIIGVYVVWLWGRLQ